MPALWRRHVLKSVMLSRLVLPALLLANAALACGPWLVRLAGTGSHVGPIASAFWRLALSVPVLAILVSRRPPARPAKFRPLAIGAVLAGLIFAGDLAAWHLGILHTRLANATLFGNVTALLFPLYGFLVARRWPLPRQAVALALAATGAALLLGRSYELSARYIAGDLLCLFAGLCYTTYLIVAARLRETLGPLATLALVGMTGAPPLLAMALATGEGIIPTDWTPLLLLTLGSQLFGQGILIFAVGRASPLVVGLMLLTQPIVAATVGWLIYGERLVLLDFCGAAAVGAALLLVREQAKPVQEAA